MVFKLLFVLANALVIIGVTANLLEKNREYDCFERFCRSVIYTALFDIFFAMILAIVGIYHLYVLIAGDFIVGAILILVVLQDKSIIKSIFSDYKTLKNHKVLYIILVIAIFVYMKYPINYMVGDRDPGLYYLNGIHIAESGSYLYEEDTFITEHYEDLKDFIMVGYPGIYSEYEFGYSDKPGDLNPQFMPMISSALAIGYDLGSIALMIRVNGVIAILSLLMLYFFLQRHVNMVVGYISVLILMLNPAQIWYGRDTVTEILLQLITFLAIDLFTQGWEEKRYILAGIAGGLLGFAVMDRIDAYIVGLSVYVMVIYAWIFDCSYKKYSFVTAIYYTLFGVLSFIYGWLYSKPYFYEHWVNFGPLCKIVLLNVLFLNAAIIIIILMKISKHQCSKNYFAVIINNKIVMGIIGACLLAIWIYAYFFRWRGLTVENNYFKQHNTVELGWYVTPVMMLLAIIGCVGILYKKEKNIKLLFFLMIGISNCLGYGYDPSVTSDHIWAARRWISIIIPFILVMGVIGAWYIGEILKKRAVQVFIMLILTVGMSMFSIYQSKAFLCTKIMENMDTQIQGIANELPDNQLCITIDAELAVYLHYVYGKTVYYCNMTQPYELAEYIDKYGDIYYIGSGDVLVPYADIYMYGLQSEHTVGGYYLEHVIGEYANELYERYWNADIYVLTGMPTN